MSETADHESGCNGEEAPPPADSPEELPAAEPPSAGFIMRLFLVPALIVMAVVGVWLLFGKLATGEHDWRKLVGDVGSNDPHRRWLGVLGLAQVLKADRKLGPQGEQLARNPLIAAELSKLFGEQLARRSRVTGDDLKRLEFLARTLGSLDVPETTLPVLREAMLTERDPQRYHDVRTSAVAAVAAIAGRRFEQGQPLDDPALAGDLVKVSKDGDRMIRQLGAYTLGLVPGETARQRLAVLLGDRDVNTQVNAAIGLARRKSTEGFPVFKTVLVEAARLAEGKNRDHRTAPSQAESADSAKFERLLVLKNVLKAVELLAGALTARQRSELADLLAPIAEGYPVRQVRVHAGQALKKLRSWQD